MNRNARSGLSVSRGLTVLCFALTLAALGGCATVKSWDLMDHEGDFEDIHKKYTQDIRWGDYEKARVFVADDAMDDFRSQIPDLQDIRFTDYEIREYDFKIDRDTATVRVTYHGYSIKTMVDRSVDETQEWAIVPETREWRVRPDLTFLRAGVVGARP
jgi:hypothetical protein